MNNVNTHVLAKFLAHKWLKIWVDLSWLTIILPRYLSVGVCAPFVGQTIRNKGLKKSNGLLLWSRSFLLSHLVYGMPSTMFATGLLTFAFSLLERRLLLNVVNEGCLYDETYGGRSN